MVAPQVVQMAAVAPRGVGVRDVSAQDFIKEYSEFLKKVCAAP